MEYDVNELKTKIDEYFSGRLSKEDIGKWAEKAYYELLKGGYVEKKESGFISVFKNHFLISH